MADTPKVRFKGFTEAWEQRKVKWFINEGIIESPMDGNHGEKHPTVSEYVSDGIPFLMASDIHNGKADVCHCKYITKERANKLDKGFAKNGDVLITHKATIGEVAILQGLKTEYAILTPQVTYYRIQDESLLNPKYLYAYFISEEFQNDLKTKAAQSTRPYIGISAQQNLMIKFPTNVREQEQIGAYFANLDTLIALHQSKCDETRELKKYMLQKMFPQNDKKIPEIRFAGFTGDWEQRKFVDIGSVSMCKRIFKEETSDDGDIPFYKIGTFGGKPDAYINRELFEEYKAKFSFPEKGDILLSASGTIGRIVEYDGEEAYFQDSNIVWLSHDKSVSNKFLKVLYPTVRWDGIEGSTIQRLYNDNFLKTKFMMPKIEEQEKLGEYFSQIDHLITLHQRKCDELKEVKKFMLQNMFPQKR